MNRTPEARTVIATTDPQLIDVLRAALTRLTDIVVLQRLDRAAGRRDWFLMTSLDDLTQIFDGSEPHDAFTFFLHPELQTRGRVNASLIRQIQLGLKGIQENTEEFLLARIVPNRALLDSEGFSPQEDKDLTAWLNQRYGELVCAGPHPPLFSTDPNIQVTAVVPDLDGKITMGVY